MTEPPPCTCRDSNNEGPLKPVPAVGGLHYRYCALYTWVPPKPVLELDENGACKGTCAYGTCGGGPTPCGGCCGCLGGCTVQYENTFPASRPDYDLDAPGWVRVADEWRWTGAGDPPVRQPPDCGDPHCFYRVCPHVGTPDPS